MYAVCKTDIGQVRSSNQDICRCGTFSDGSAWTVVCDGMGGVNRRQHCKQCCLRRHLQSDHGKLHAGYGRRRSARYNAACNQ